MDSKDEIEVIQLAIKKLIEENQKGNKASSESFVADDEDQFLLSRLLSRLESLKNNSSTSKPLESPAETRVVPSSTATKESGNETFGDRITEMGTEEIVKELREVKRQNSVTHWLLSIMIVLTAVWQLSEVSLILRVKSTFSNPFRSVGSMITEMIKGRSKKDPELPQLEAPQLHGLKVPEFPHVDFPELLHVDLPALISNGEED